MIKHVVKINRPQFAVVNRISRFAIKTEGDNLSTLPPGALLDPDGNVLYDPDGNVLLAGDGLS